jgi:hypothetical protein
MQEKQTARVFVEMFLIIMMLGMLSATALPLIGNMGGSGASAGTQVESRSVNTAEREMLRTGPSGDAGPVGHAVDTSDEPPLCRADYILNTDNGSAGLSYLDSFAADGTVTQVIR